MGIWQVIMLILAIARELPTIIAIVREIIALIGKLRSGKELQTNLSKLYDAVEHFKKTGDALPLNELREALKKRRG